MSLALFGLIVLQFFWIRNVHQLTEERFERDVQKAIDKSVLDLEKLEQSMLMNMDDFRAGLKGSYEDFFMSEFGEMLNPQEEIKVRDTMVERDGVVSRYLVVEGMATDTATGLRVEQKIITESFGQVVPNDIENSVLGTEYSNAFIIELNRSFERQILAKAKRLNELMMNMFNSNFFDDIKLRMNLRMLDSIMAHNLNHYKIDTAFTYNIVSLEGEAVDFQNSSRHHNRELAYNGEENIYRAKLFPGDFVMSNHEILVSFPAQSSLIWKEMTTTLIGSVCLILIVLLAFYFAVATIIKQKRLSEIKNDFISNMTHELKTPISTISLACEAMADKSVVSNDETRDSYIGMISQENKRLSKLVENVLQTALIDKGKLTLNKEETDLSTLINNIVSAVQIRYAQKGGKVKFATKSLKKIAVDTMHFGNVIYNLLDNSLKYTSNPPEVNIDVFEDGNKTNIVVQDNGIGMKNEELKRIFDKLYRIPTGDVHNVKGFGLGLSYVQSIINLHGGSIKVKSEQNKGTVFTITLNNE